MVRILLVLTVMILGIAPHKPAMAQESIYNGSSKHVGGNLSSRGYSSNGANNNGTKGPIYIKGLLRNTNPKTASSEKVQSYKPFTFSDTSGVETSTGSSSADRLEGQIESYKAERKQYKEDRAKRRTKLLEKYKSKGAIGSRNNNQGPSTSTSNSSTSSARHSSSRGSSLSRNSVTSRASVSNTAPQQRRVSPAYSSSRSSGTSTPSKVFNSY